MSKQATLFNFFKKAPEKSGIENVKASESPSIKLKEGATLKENRVQSGNWDLCDIVWAKLDGYPWWPGLVCQDPNRRQHLTKNKLHVQFFDNPPTRAWVNRETAVAHYNLGKDEKRCPSKSNSKELEQLERACKEADEAVAMSKDDRGSLLIDFTSTPCSDSSFKEDSEESPGTDKENTGPSSAKKAKVLIFDSDDSTDEYKPGKDDHSDDDEEPSGEESDHDQEEVSAESEENSDGERKTGKKRKLNTVAKTPRSKIRKQSATGTPKSVIPTTPTTPRSISSATLQKIASFKANATPDSGGSSDGNWPHLKLPFLQPDKIMDKNKRRPDHPEYDRRTLYVPEDFKNQCSPAMRQWWELKSEHWDCVLFFKVGKFYELYHMDAVIGVNELFLSYMRGEFAHSGFPEIAYGRFSTILVQKGRKVARVEQMETPEMMNGRCKNSQRKTTKFDKVVQREVCQVTTRGTLSHNVMDGAAVEPQANYLLALTEKDSSYGVCFIDASIGVFHLGQFTDDKFLSRLRTLLSHCAPVQIIFEKKEMTSRTMQLLSSTMSGVLQEPLQSESEFWSASKTLNVLAAREELQDADGRVNWPLPLKDFISPSDALGLTPADDGELALKALGACVGYLQRSFLDTQLLSMKKFKVYTPIDSQTSSFGRYMVLDDVTLTNLEVLRNSRGDVEGTLLNRLDRCVSFPGKRLLRQWLCSPLCEVKEIHQRQCAIAEFLDKQFMVTELRSLFKNIPDLERLIAKIHSQGNAIISKSHPDSRAIFFEEKVYSKRKIQDFLLTLTGFDKLQQGINYLKGENPNSEMLKRIADCPDLSPQLKFFDEAFDHDLARKEGCIVPKTSGVDPDYDSAMSELASIEQELKEYLKSQCQYFGVQVKYFGTDRNRYQLEISEAASKKANSNYEFTSSRKGFKRFVTKETKEFLRRQIQAEEAKSSALSDLRRKVFEQFSSKQEDWMQAVRYLAEMDVLMALADFASSEGEICRPEFDTSSKEPYIMMEAGRHPCIPVSDGFIPNSIFLGTDEWRSLVLLTGPNMGGKSTLLRQLGLHIILAHIGSYVPASSARLTPVDRVFTRIGAADDILAGESTFFQELSETSTILQHASPHSVVLVDELGRGTSTYDGTAIAHAVVTALASRHCRTLFSTHYHSLVEELKSCPSVSLGHMACLAEGESITFLYQFVKGACPSSHGFHAARLAGLPDDIIRFGMEKAEQLMKEGLRRQLFRKICRPQVTSEEISNLTKTIASVL